MKIPVLHWSTSRAWPLWSTSPVPLLLLILQVALVEDEVLEEPLLLVQLGVAPELPQVPLRNTPYCSINTVLQY